MVCSKYMRTGYVQCGNRILEYIFIHYLPLLHALQNLPVDRVIPPTGKSRVVFSNPDPLTKLNPGIAQNILAIQGPTD